MKLTDLRGGCFHVIPYPTWKWFEFIIFFLINSYNVMSSYLYFPNNLKNIKDHTQDYIISCKFFLL